MEEEKVDTIATPDALIQSPRTESTEVAGSEQRRRT
jgi:hypothetical protein